MENFAQLAADVGGLPPHPTTQTPRGFHHIFRQNGEPLGNGTGSLTPGIDVRGDGGWIVAPGAVRPDGVIYSPHPGSPLLAEAYVAGTIPPIPEKIDALLRAPTCRPERASTGPTPSVANGGPLDVEAALAALKPGSVSDPPVSTSRVTALVSEQDFATK